MCATKFMYFLCSQLLCWPPEHQPPSAGGHSSSSAGGSELPEVTVHVGPSLRYHLGYVQYNNGHGRGAADDFMSSEIIGAIAAVTAVLVAVGIVVLIVMKHKSSQVRFGALAPFFCAFFVEKKFWQAELPDFNFFLVFGRNY